MERDVKFNSNTKVSSGQRAGKDRNNAGRQKDVGKIKNAENKLPAGEYDYFGLYSNPAAGKKSHGGNSLNNASAGRAGKSAPGPSGNSSDLRGQKASQGKSASSSGRAKDSKTVRKSASSSAQTVRNKNSAKGAPAADSTLRNRNKSSDNASVRSSQKTRSASKANSAAGNSAAKGISELSGRKSASGGSANISSGRRNSPGAQTKGRNSGANVYGQRKTSAYNSQNVQKSPAGTARSGSANAALTDKPKQQKENKRRKRRRHGSPILLYIMLIILVLGISAVLCCTVFFGAESIEVLGTSRYSAEQIISASSLITGDNIFVSDTSDAESRIVTQLPYIKSAEISRRLFPAKFVITIEETQAKYITEDGSALLDNDFKVLENNVSSDMDKTGLTVLKGVNLVSSETGKPAAFENEDISDILKQISAGLDKHKISDITKIDLIDTMDIRITYQDRILMMIGSAAELEYKMSYANTMLTKQLSSTQEGKLDLSWLVSGNSTVYFTQGSIEMFEAEGSGGTSSGSGTPAGTSSDSGSTVSDNGTASDAAASSSGSAVSSPSSDSSTAGSTSSSSGNTN